MHRIADVVCFVILGVRTLSKFICIYKEKTLQLYSAGLGVSVFSVEERQARKTGVERDGGAEPNSGRFVAAQV